MQNEINLSDNRVQTQLSVLQALMDDLSLSVLRLAHWCHTGNQDFDEFSKTEKSIKDSENAIIEFMNTRVSAANDD
jgi:hypothetical protein